MAFFLQVVQKRRLALALRVLLRFQAELAPKWLQLMPGSNVLLIRGLEKGAHAKMLKNRIVELIGILV